jgi:cytochrome d ubiquinol oxidase subunit II
MLETIWFVLWGILWAVYFMLDGFDFGIGTLNPFIARSETDRRISYNAMGPFWDGNEVWLITAGGVTFAAFPTTYAVLFSSLYSPLLLILFCLIIRGAAFEFRSKVDDRGWRVLWDICHFIGSFGPALLFGVAFANIFMGIPIDKEGVYHGSMLGLLNPYGILGGLLFVFLFLVHGALWLKIKASGPLEERAAKTAGALWWPLAVIAVAFLVASWFYTNLYHNYLVYPVLWLIPVAAVAGLLLTKVFIMGKAWWKAWFASCVTIVGATWFGVAGLFPNLLPSSIDPAASLTVFNSSSSTLTLTIMLVVALIFVPIVIVYQTWGYYLFKDKLTEEDLASDEAY